MTNDSLFQALTLGNLTLPNRILMAPLTRSRSKQPGDIPWELNAEYYAQRASAGLIISEASQVSRQGQGYAFTPGIYNDEQVAGWRLVTDAVHRQGGRIFLQLWHVGRISHIELQPDGRPPVAPSPIRAAAQTYISADSGMVDVSEPRALDTAEIEDIVEQFRAGAERAKLAGFDGVEVHGANGYLLDQFTRDGSNQRSDGYGGTLEGRLRLPIEVALAVSEVWGAERVGYRISPTNAFNDMSDSDPRTTFTALAAALGEMGLAYIHVVEAFGEQPRDEVICGAVRSAFTGAYIANGGYTAESGSSRIASGMADAVAYGVLYIANPDLPARMSQGAELNKPDAASFYGGDSRGYTDYPSLPAGAV